MVQPSMLKSHKHLNMIEIHFYRFLLYNGWLQNHCWLSAKGMTPNFVVFVSVLLPICCHIGWGMPYLRMFLKKLSRYKVQLLINGCGHFMCSELEHK